MPSPYPTHRRRPAVAALAVLAAVIAAAPWPARGQEPSAEEVEEYRLIQGLLEDGIEGTAADRIDAFLLSYPDSQWRTPLTLRLGELRLRGGDPEAAATALRDYLERAPGDEQTSQVRYLLAGAEETAGRNDVARALCREVIADRATPDELRLQAQVRLAGLATAAGDHEEAASTLEAVTKKLEEPRLLLQLGNAYFELRRLKEARAAYGKLVDEGAVLPEPDQRAMLANLALIQFHFGDFDEALAILEPLHQQHPEDFRIRATLAWTYYELGRYPEAYDRMKEAEADDPHRAPRDLLRSAREAKIDRRFQDAAAALTRIVDGPAPHHLLAEAHHELAGIALAEGEVATGVRELLAFAAESPDPREAALARLQAGELQRDRQGDPGRAIATFESLLADPTTDWMTDRVLRHLAEAQLGAGDGRGAISTLTRLVTEHPSSPERPHAYLLLGRAEERIGDLENAATSYATVVLQHTQSPWKEEALFSVGLVEMKLHRWDRAAGAFAAFLEEHAESGRALAATMNLGHAVMRAGDVEAARDAFASARRLAPEGGAVADEALFFEARALEALGSLADAAERYRELASADLPGPWAEEARFRAALCLRGQDLADEAIAELRGLAQSQPESRYAPWALWEAAEIDLQRELEDDAVRTLAGLRDSFPESDLAAAAQERMEMILLTTNRIQEALESMPAFAHNNPGSFIRAEELLGRARDLAAEGQAKKATAVTQELLQRYPGSREAAAAQFDLGRKAYEEERFTDARAHLLHVLDSPEAGDLRGEALFLLGNVEFTQGQYERAARRYEECLAEDPPPARRSRVHYLRGSSLHRLGEVATALDEFVRFRETLPDRTDLVDEQIQAGVWLQQGGRLEDAERAFASLVEVVRGTGLQPEVQYYLAETLELSGDTEGALVQYLKVAYGRGGEAEADWRLAARFHAGKIYESRGQFQDAIKLYQGIAESRAGTKQGEFAAQKVRELSGESESPQR